MPWNWKRTEKFCVTHKTSTQKYLFTEISARGPAVEEEFAVGNAAPGEAATPTKAPSGNSGADSPFPKNTIVP